MPLTFTAQTQMLFESYNEYPFHVAVYVYGLVRSSGPTPSLLILVIINGCQAISTIGSSSRESWLTVIGDQWPLFVEIVFLTSNVIFNLSL